MSDLMNEMYTKEQQKEMSEGSKRQREIPEICLTCCCSMDEDQLCGFYPGNPRRIERRLGFSCSKYVKNLSWVKKEGQRG